MNTAYCILHEEMVALEPGLISGHMIECRGDSIYDPPEIEFCDFPDGWATCPPPEFDMDEFLKAASGE